MNNNLVLNQDKIEDSSWKKIIVNYQQPAVWRSVWQIVNSLVPYVVLKYLMYLSLTVSYWKRRSEWDYTKAALEGSSFYQLPMVLQWFSGNIGFHHIHHLSARIPNYRLEDCHKAHPLFQSVMPVTLFASFRTITFRLWDEQRQRLVGFGHVRRLCRQQNQETAAAF